MQAGYPYLLGYFSVYFGLFTSKQAGSVLNALELLRNSIYEKKEQRFWEIWDKNKTCYLLTPDLKIHRNVHNSVIVNIYKNSHWSTCSTKQQKLVNDIRSTLKFWRPPFGGYHECSAVKTTPFPFLFKIHNISKIRSFQTLVSIKLVTEEGYKAEHTFF